MGRQNALATFEGSDKQVQFCVRCKVIVFHFFPKPDYVISGRDRAHHNEIMEQVYAIDAKHTAEDALQPIPEKL